MEKVEAKKVLVNKGKEISEETGCAGEGKMPSSRKIYMDYNATTPLAPEVIQTVSEAMREAWGNPSSSYTAGQRAKEIINEARQNLARLVGGQPQDIIFTSGGTEVRWRSGKRSSPEHTSKQFGDPHCNEAF